MYKSDRGGTSDLIFIFSDLTYNQYDFKTMYPKQKFLSKQRTLNDASWIPFYKYEEWGMQLPKTRAALDNVVGLKGQRESRIVPIQIDFQWDKLNKKTTEKVSNVRTFADNDSYLEQIPIGELTGIKELDVNLGVLYRIKKNHQLELEKKPSHDRAEFLKARIDKLNLSINKLIVKKDVAFLVNDYNNLIKKFANLTNTGEIKSLKDIDKITTQELEDLKVELEGIRGVVSSTGQYYSDMNIEESEAIKYANTIHSLHFNLDVLNKM